VIILIFEFINADAADFDSIEISRVAGSFSDMNEPVTSAYTYYGTLPAVIIVS